MGKRMTEAETIDGKKKFHPKDLNNIAPLNFTQKQFFENFDRHDTIMALGSAGTGKTFIAMYLGLRAVLEDNGYRKLLIVRSCVPTREIGFLPGSKEEKEEVYTEPYSSACESLFKYKNYKKTFERLQNIGIVEFMSTTFLRGTTFDNTIILVDEMQNMTWQELHTVMTRLGTNSKIIFCGDGAQDDLYRKRSDKSGFQKFVDVMLQFGACDIRFTNDDVVRSDTVKRYLKAVEDYESRY